MEQDKKVVIRIENVGKTYRLGVIGSGTLQGDLQSLMARLLHKEDPNRRIGQPEYAKGDTFRALDGVSLDVYRGETLGVIGANGAGKSTLLKLLSRVTAPTQGRIRVKGRIASMLEVGTGFHGELTGRENVYLNGAIMGMTRSEVDQRMEEIIQFAEIGPFMDTPVKRYSSGMYVKLAFSVAAHLNAEILIMDEVLAVGDARFQRKCIEKIRQLAREQDKTVIFVSHNMDTISTMCDRCAVLEQGKLQFVGSTEQAIELYCLRQYGKNGVFCDLAEKPRPRGQVFPVRMESIQFPDKNEAIFDATEGVPAVLRWESRQLCTDVCIRVTLQYNGVPIGTYISPCLEGAIAPGSYETCFVLQTDMLTPGTYTAACGMYRHTAEGLHSPLDYVDHAFAFEISKGKLENRGWNHRFWGSVLLRDMTITKQTQLAQADTTADRK